MAPRQIVATPNLGLRALGCPGVALLPGIVDRSRRAKSVQLPNFTGASPRVIRTTVARAVVEFAIDDSGSMSGTAYGDTTGVRYSATASLLRLMRRSGGGQAGVIHWGSRVGEVLPISDIRKRRRSLERALSIGPNLGGTEMAPALHRASLELSPLALDTIPVVFVITDGICEPDSQVIAAMSTLPPGSVHLLLVDRSNACPPELEAAWRATPAKSVTRLNHLDTKDMALTLAQVFAKALGLTHAPSPVDPNPNK